MEKDPFPPGPTVEEIHFQRSLIGDIQLYTDGKKDSRGNWIVLPDASRVSLARETLRLYTQDLWLLHIAAICRKDKP
jgi:hypothetical protein